MLVPGWGGAQESLGAGGVVGLDLEWVPDTDDDEDRQTRVALLQLASPTVALLVRVVGVTRLPPPLLRFLRCRGRRSAPSLPPEPLASRSIGFHRVTPISSLFLDAETGTVAPGSHEQGSRAGCGGAGMELIRRGQAATVLWGGARRLSGVR